MVERTIEIQLLGGIAVKRAGKPVHLSLSGVTLEMLGYLLSQGREVRRDALANQFWEEFDPARARAALNTALWRINKQLRDLPGLTLVSTAETVALETPEGSLDIGRLETAVRAAVKGRDDPAEALGDALRTDLAGAVDSHGGPFLDGCGSAWAVVQRERLFNLYLRALGLLMYDSGRRRDYEEALDYGRRLLAADPFHEQAQCQVMWLYMLNGQRVRALIQFRNYDAQLREEMGIRPMPETRALFDLIRADPVSDAGPELLDDGDSLRRHAGSDPVGRLKTVMADCRADLFAARHPWA